MSDTQPGAYQTQDKAPTGNMMNEKEVTGDTINED